MHLVILAHNARDGDAIGTQVAAKVRAARAAGWSVRVLVNDAAVANPGVADAIVQANADAVWHNLEQRAWLTSADLVLVEFGGDFDLLQLLPALAGGSPRIIFSYYGVTPSRLWEPADRPRMEAAEAARRYVWCADAVYVTSDFVADELSMSAGLPREQMVTMPCVVPLVDVLTPNTSARRGVRLLYVGRAAINKRLPTLIRALARLHAPDYPVELRLVGPQDGVFAAEVRRCQSLARELGVGSQVQFVGKVPEPELLAAYHSAAALLLPSVHEGFGVPCVEAMAAGVPVLAARAAALPETIGPAGLLFSPDDDADLAEQLARVLSPARPAAHALTAPRVAIVAPRFGSDFAGGAETSLRRMALALSATGLEVEVFTTCNRHDSQWGNHLRAGTIQDDGLVVHRHPIDAVDQTALGECYREICQRKGLVSGELEQTYLQHSLQSTALVAALRSRAEQFAAIITGPYLFALTHRVVDTFGKKVLLAPCFHDEPLARLNLWRNAYRNVGGMLFHTAAEQHFAEAQLHLNHPNSTVIGTHLPTARPGDAAHGRNHVGTSTYVVYCGRYCPEKGLEELLAWFATYANAQPGRVKLVCLGHGAMTLPRVPWLVDLGFVPENVKRDVLAGAMGLVLLSKNESLSIVILEAWQAGRPVIGHRACAVVRDQITQAGGGVTVASAAEFHATLEHWRTNPARADALGACGQQFVRGRYEDLTAYADRLKQAITNLQRPVRELLIENGQHRARSFGFAAWSARWVDSLRAEALTPRRARQATAEVRIVPTQLEACPTSGRRLVSLRVTNTGDLPLACRGPAAWVVRGRVCDSFGRAHTLPTETALPDLLIPGETAVVVAAVLIPEAIGAYQAQFCVEPQAAPGSGMPASVPLHLSEPATMPSHPAQAFIAEAQTLLADLQRTAALPTDYCDVTTGMLAPLKRWAKQKLLNNFRRAYVDVLARQQAEFNQRSLALLGCLMDGMAALTAPKSGTGQAATEPAEGEAHLRARLERLRRARRRDRQRLRRLEARLRLLERRDNSLKEAAA